MHAKTWTTKRTLADCLFRIRIMPGKHRRFFAFGIEF